MDIQAAKKRCEAATPGEWTPGADGTSLWSGDVVVFTAPTMDHLSRKQRKANIKFAAHARSDLPAALEALEEGIVALETLPPRPGLWRLKKVVAILKGESK